MLLRYTHPLCSWFRARTRTSQSNFIFYYNHGWSWWNCVFKFLYLIICFVRRIYNIIYKIIYKIYVRVPVAPAIAISRKVWERYIYVVANLQVACSSTRIMYLPYSRQVRCSQVVGCNELSVNRSLAVYVSHLLFVIY